MLSTQCTLNLFTERFHILLVFPSGHPELRLNGLSVVLFQPAHKPYKKFRVYLTLKQETSHCFLENLKTHFSLPHISLCLIKCNGQPSLVRVARFELARCFQQGILSPWCLPIPPYPHFCVVVWSTSLPYLST